MVETLLVMAGGAMGSALRYWCGVGATRLFGPSFPVGTLLINIVGSFVLAFLTGLGGGLAVGARARLLLGTGFCGGFTTFSTFSVESLALIERGDHGLAALYLAGSLLGGLAGGWLGLAVARLR